MLLGSECVKAVRQHVGEINPMCQLETLAPGPSVTRCCILTPICVSKYELFVGNKKYGYQIVI